MCMVALLKKYSTSSSSVFIHWLSALYFRICFKASMGFRYCANPVQMKKGLKHNRLKPFFFFAPPAGLEPATL